MITRLPEDLLLEIIELLSFDIQTLRSCALMSYAWAQRCRPYIFREVNLGEKTNPEPRYRKLRDVLEKNSSFADYTHELCLYIGRVKPEAGASGDGFIDITDPGLPQFLGHFNQLEEVSISQSYDSRDARIPKTLVKPFMRVLGLETLRDVTLWDFMCLPISILDHAPYVTNLSLYAIDFDTWQDQDQTPPPAPSQTPNDPPLCHRAPISLTVKYCPPYIHEDLERLVREERGLFEYHWIEKLVLGPNCHDPNVDEIGFCSGLLKAVGRSQEGVDGETGLTQFTLQPSQGILLSQGDL
ncbi:hypothetical protein EST38_g4315 [Candolleomyces aberdarensis]|uniref:F-box domain-containing protein n=1 Tax=Candolleomyces aberdarensis TaxID=2316362 RepID=A0A4Q2DRL9_9AGAR|nr:hypothetical protein EST38_g4315 [Candolleomyces aberdarensis]